MERLHAHRWALLGASGAAAGLIVLLAPHYLVVQRAANAAALRTALPAAEDHRYVAAAAVDLVFTMLYALTAAAFVHPTVGSRIGALLVCLGSAADEVENLYVLRNVCDKAAVTDHMVAAMRAWGTAKWWLIGAGVLLMAGTYACDRLRVRGPG